MLNQRKIIMTSDEYKQQWMKGQRPLPIKMSKEAKDFILLWRDEIDPMSPQMTEKATDAWEKLSKKHKRQVAKFQGWALPGQVYG